MDKLLERIKQFPIIIRNIENPPLLYQLEAIRSDITVFKYLKNPDKVTIKEALNIDPSQIKYVKNPTYDMKKMLILIDYRNALYIDDLPLDLQNMVIDEVGGCGIEYIKNPHIQIQQRCFNMDPIRSIQYITNPQLLLDIIRIYPKMIKYIENPSEELQLECLKQNPKYIDLIKDPCSKAISYCL